MAFDFKIKTHPKYVTMVYKGSYDHSLANQFTDQVLATCKEYQPSKLLIDMRQVEGQMSTMDRFNLAVLAAAKYFGAKLTGQIPGCRYAIVGNHPLVDKQKFEETVAINRGINIKVSTDIKEAFAWLKVK